MAEIVALGRTADCAAVMGRVARVLRAGRMVALPTESGYCVAASGLFPEGVQRMPGPAAEPLTVALRGADEAREWAPNLSTLGRRLARRCWPGRMTLAVNERVEEGVLAWLPEKVRPRISPAGTIHLQVHAHQVIAEVLRNVYGPLLLAPIAADAAEQVQQAAGDVDLVIDAGPFTPVASTLVAVEGSTWRTLRSGAISEEQIKQRAACLIVFVCTGNTCRSPLAEALFRKQLAERLGCREEELPSRGFFVLSAGLAAMMGGGAAAEAVEVARVLGADLSSHRTRALSIELAAQADYLVAMTQAHLLALVDHFPQLSAVPRLLDPTGYDLMDPIGQDQEVYAACGRQIWENVQPLLAEIVAA